MKTIPGIRNRTSEDFCADLDDKQSRFIASDGIAFWLRPTPANPHPHSSKARRNLCTLSQRRKPHPCETCGEKRLSARHRSAAVGVPVSNSARKVGKYCGGATNTAFARIVWNLFRGLTSIQAKLLCAFSSSSNQPLRWSLVILLDVRIRPVEQVLIAVKLIFMQS